MKALSGSWRVEMQTQLLADENVIKSKLSNAMITTAQPNQTFDAITDTFGSAKAARSGIKTAEKLVGGIWVGGRTTLTNLRVIFEPNAFNTALQDGIGTVIIPLKDIIEVRTRWGVLTSIVELQTSDECFAIRCFGAKGFAATVEAAREQV